MDDRGARYELRVTNGTPGPLAATVSAIRVDEGRPIAALAVEVQPHAVIRTGFALDVAMAYERVAAEVHGHNVHLVVEAPPPRGGKSLRRWVAPAGAAGGAALLAGAVLMSFAFGRPRVVDAALLATPDGKLVARWSTSGKGSRSYELRDAAGAVVASGMLPAPAGTMPVGRGDAASLHVAIANAFGADTREAAYGRATPPPAIRIVATSPPRIASITVDPPRANAPLVVHYSAVARDLRLSILDRSGATWFATTTPSGTGVTQVPAPPAGEREPYVLVARAEGASGDESTRVPLPAAFVPPPTAAPAPSPPPGAVTGAVAGAGGSNATVIDVGGGDTFTIRPYPVPPGDPFVVEIPFVDGARIQVMRDRDDVELSGADLRRGERSVALRAPVAPGSYTVRVTLQRGVGQETVVRPLRLTGR
ncbi:MAG TPA: hypothetical protein VHT53_08875 [Candidatus Elarobacter sp.]|nr:hypothetical protein [Candidatus Elarobacter sp.]